MVCGSCNTSEKERFTVGLKSLVNSRLVRRNSCRQLPVGHIYGSIRDKNKSRIVTFTRKWQARAAWESAASMWLLGNLMNVALASVIYYGQADDFLILPDAGVGRASFWVPGHAWGFQTDTVCKKDTLEDVSAQTGKFRVLFCSITGKFSKVCEDTVVDGSSLVWVHPIPSCAVSWALT